MKQVLLWSRRILFAGAVVLLGYCGFVLIDTRIFQKEEDRQLERLLTAPGEPTSPVSLGISSPALTGGLIGRMDKSGPNQADIAKEGAL